MRQMIKKAALGSVLVSLVGVTGCATNSDLEQLRADLQSVNRTARHRQTRRAPRPTLLLQRQPRKTPALLAGIPTKSSTGCSRNPCTSSAHRQRLILQQDVPGRITPLRGVRPSLLHGFPKMVRTLEPACRFCGRWPAALLVHRYPRLAVTERDQVWR